LAALALLSGLMLAGVEWSVTAARIAADSGAAGRWNAGAWATLDRIDEDLAQGDFGSAEEDRPRVWATEAGLTIDTRDGGPVRVVYAVKGGTLVRAAGGERALLGRVVSLACSVEGGDGEAGNGA